MLGLGIRSASMACLLPDSLPLLPKATPRHRSRSKEYLRAQCMLSSTTVVKPEKLQIPSFESLSASVTSVEPLTHIGGATRPSLEEEISTKLPAEGLLENEDSVIAAAAAEVVALARSAVKTAKDAAQMAGSYSLKQGTEDVLSEVEVLQSEMARLFSKESNEETACSNVAEAQSEDAHSDCSLNVEPDIMKNGSSFLQVQDSEGIAVKSTRQTERRTRRLHASENKKVDAFSTCSVPYRQNSHAKSRNDNSSPKKSKQPNSSDPVAYLLPTIRQYKLLTAEEEVELSLGIQDFRKLQRLKEELAVRNGSLPNMSQWAAAAGVSETTLRKRIDYGSFCRDKMVYSNLRLVIKIARKYENAKAGLDFPDLIQEGCKGLITGCERFDGSRGFKFSTYATWWIKQAIKKGLSEKSRFIRLPYRIIGAQFKINKMSVDFRRRHGRAPTEAEMVKETGLTPKVVRAAMSTPKTILSLEQNIYDNSSMKRYEVLEDTKIASAESTFIKKLRVQELYAALDKLTPREREVVKLRYGLQGSSEMTLQEIGQVLGISRERVRQVEVCAFRKMKNRKNSEIFEHLKVT